MSPEWMCRGKMKSQSLILVEIILLVMLSSSGHTQPKDYHSNSNTDFDTGHIRGPHHPRSTRGSTNHEHHHYVPHKQDGGVATDHSETKLTHDIQLLHDKEHIKEDLGEWAFQDGKDMSPEEMEFHYFKTHDFDNNSMLDGLEILQAIQHVLPMADVETDLTAPSQSNDHHHHDNTGKAPESGTDARAPLSESRRAEIMKQREEDFNYYVELIDKVLAEDDLNHDGYLSYMEYSIGRRREEEIQRQNANAKQYGQG